MIDSLQLWSEDPGDDSTFGLELLEAASSPEERESLIGELIFLDVERQRLLGKKPTEARYHALFPEDQDAASSHFAEAVLAFDSSKNSSAEIELGDRYEILEQIGEGGMGRVYRVRDTKLSRNLAIKVLRSDLKESNSIWRRFFARSESARGLATPGNSARSRSQRNKRRLAFHRDETGRRKKPR